MKHEGGNCGERDVYSGGCKKRRLEFVRQKGYSRDKEGM
jgi:hypothetical protein